jgi:hypothetical protein
LTDTLRIEPLYNRALITPIGGSMSLRIATLLLVFLGATSAWSQTNDDRLVPPGACGEGLVATDATDGHCCWPGQAWSEERERCTGAPRCPRGWEARGSFCIRGEVVSETKAPTARAVEKPAPPSSPPSVERAEPPLATEVEPAPRKERTRDNTLDLATRMKLLDLYFDAQNRKPVEYNGGPIPAGWHLDSRVRKGLIIPGSIMLGVSYSISAYVALTLPACRQGYALTGLVPIVGSLISSLSEGSDCWSYPGTSLLFGLLSSGHQIAGLTMILVGAKRPNRFLVPNQTASNERTLELVAGTALTMQGLTLVGRF